MLRIAARAVDYSPGHDVKLSITHQLCPAPRRAFLLSVLLGHLQQPLLLGLEQQAARDRCGDLTALAPVLNYDGDRDTRLSGRC